jgi:uncharacterized LabA/DUF88 family protein
MSVLLFIDVENIYRSIGKKYSRRLDYEKYLRFLEQRFNGEIAVKIAYGSQKPRDARGFISLLKALSFTTKFDEGIDWNVPIALAAIELATIGSIVVLGSNHKNLGPLIEALHAKGVRTFVCGCCVHPNLKHLSEYHEIDESLLITPNNELEGTNGTVSATE